METVLKISFRQETSCFGVPVVALEFFPSLLLCGCWTVGLVKRYSEG